MFGRRKHLSLVRETATAVPLDGRAVGKEITRVARPVLREAGFEDFTARKAWRNSAYTVDHVTFRSYNAYNAGVLGCTSYSFTVEVGVFFRCIQPYLDRRPEDYDCQFRAILGKNVEQPYFQTEWGPAKDRPEVWYVLPDGSNLTDVVTLATEVLARDGLPFLDRLHSPEGAFEALMNERMTNVSFNQPGVMLPGNPDSPNWREASLAIGHLIIDDPRSAIRSAPVLRDE